MEGILLRQDFFCFKRMKIKAAKTFECFSGFVFVYPKYSGSNKPLAALPSP